MSDSSKPAEFPALGRLLGLDYGTKRVGVAVSNSEQTIASPLKLYQRQNESSDARQLTSLAGEYEVVGLVVGLPIHTGGEEGLAAGQARQFGAWAASATGLPVTFWDERFTSALAEDLLLNAELTKARRKERIDKVAAQIMLQSFLDYNRNPDK